ncbi:hypothetical protein PQ465_19195 [Sphingobacterium oryzagri]|uniref:Uncharacterized protein n=1 Tax=Sphingobacterium oryzagri TaxID=3025669 RepID=A0ABY7WFK8_9SPHI|nr:hypothetical protein [Sphingobacterium sp. KACC 22765]WDF68407.1 hypothetical protein PQ465_19195 [Sphingobacterium sp. KACC 22765]
MRNNLIELESRILFDSLLTIQVDIDTYIDLHNDYNCYSISYAHVSKELYLRFEFCEGKERKVDLVFKEVEINKMSFNLGDLEDVKTIDNLYRGKYEIEGKLKEFTDDGKSYYYIEFCADLSFELFAKKLFAVYS